jgi:hypothetical protein
LRLLCPPLLCCYEGSYASATVAHVHVHFKDITPIVVIEWGVLKTALIKKITRIIFAVSSGLYFVIQFLKVPFTGAFLLSLW